MTINQKYHKLGILNNLMDSLDGYEEATKENLQYELDRLKEGGEEENDYRKKNIKNYKDRLEAIKDLRKDFDKLA